MKQYFLSYNVIFTFVAPRAGAWIETGIVLDGDGVGAVAPRAGAWIEPPAVSVLPVCHWSLPARERGLKPSACGIIYSSFLSLPARERGLKQENLLCNKLEFNSRSPRGSVD